MLPLSFYYIAAFSQWFPDLGHSNFHCPCHSLQHALALFPVVVQGLADFPQLSMVGMSGRGPRTQEHGFQGRSAGVQVFLVIISNAG
jgi:hypothetical protein